MSDRPNTACPPDGRYIEVLACNTGIADQNGNASVTLRNNSPYTVTGVTLALFGTDASKAGSMIPPVEAVSMIPPVEAVSPPVPPDAEFRITIRVPERWSSFRAEVSAFRSGDLVFTRARGAADVRKRFEAFRPEFTTNIPSDKADREIALVPRWRKAAVWLTLAGAALVTLLTVFF